MASPTFQLRIAFATKDPFSSSPTWTDVSTDLIEATLSRGRQRELDRCDTGNATFTLDNSSWQYLPGYTSALYNPNVLPLKRIQLNVTVSGTIYSLFTGYINRYEIDWNDPGYSTVKLGCTDALGLFQNAPLIGAFPQQLTSARVAAILTNIGWPTADRNIRTATQTCPAKTYVSTDDQSALPGLNQTADTEPGTLFVDGAGIVNFSSGFAGTGTMPAALGDRADLGEVQCDGGTLSLADDVLWNDLRGRRDGATTEVRVTSSSSWDQFQKHQQSKSTYNANDTTLAQTLGAFLNRYQYPTQLFDPVQVMPAGDLNNAFSWCCLAEIGKAVVFNRTPPAATGLPRFSQACVLNWLQHEIKPGTGQEWTTTIRLAGATLH